MKFIYPKSNAFVNQLYSFKAKRGGFEFSQTETDSAFRLVSDDPINNSSIIKRGMFSEFLDAYENFHLAMSDVHSKEYDFYKRFIDKEALPLPLKQTYSDLFVLFLFSPFLESKQLTLLDSFLYLEHKNPILLYVLQNLITICGSGQKETIESNSLGFAKSLYEFNDSKNLPFFFKLLSNLDHSPSQLMKLAGTDFMALSLAFACTNDLNPSSSLQVKKFLGENNKDKIALYLARSKPLPLTPNWSIDIYQESNLFDINVFKLWVLDNEFQKLMNQDGLDQLVERCLDKGFICERNGKDYFSIEGRALANYVDSRMFAKLMR